MNLKDCEKLRIGLLEDDQAQIDLIRLWVNELDGQLEAYTSGSEFRQAMKRDQYDLIVLDWHLPDTTGIRELDWLRNEKSSTAPVLFITSRDSEDSIIEALDHGADDYMVKPVNKNVTLARIKALQRRHKLTSHDQDTRSNEAEEQISKIENYGSYQVNTEEHSIAVEGELVKLTNKEYELALYLFRNAGSLLSRDDLLETIWGTRGDLNTRTVDTHISRIRAKLRINPGMGWQLSSIYQRGYRLFRVGQE